MKSQQTFSLVSAFSQLSVSICQAFREDLILGGHLALEKQKINMQIGLTAPYVDDGLIEVVGFQSAFRSMVLLAPKGHGDRLAQVHRIHFEFHKGAADHTFMKIDGEPWKQSLPKDDDTVIVEISHCRQVTVLVNDPCRSKSIDDPMSPSCRYVDDNDSDSLEDEDECDERK